MKTVKMRNKMKLTTYIGRPKHPMALGAEPNADSRQLHSGSAPLLSWHLRPCRCALHYVLFPREGKDVRGVRFTAVTPKVMVGKPEDFVQYVYDADARTLARLLKHGKVGTLIPNHTSGKQARSCRCWSKRGSKHMPICSFNVLRSPVEISFHGVEFQQRNNVDFRAISTN